MLIPSGVRDLAAGEAGFWISFPSLLFRRASLQGPFLAPGFFLVHRPDVRPSCPVLSLCPPVHGYLTYLTAPPGGSERRSVLRLEPSPGVLTVLGWRSFLVGSTATAACPSPGVWSWLKTPLLSPKVANPWFSDSLRVREDLILRFVTSAKTPFQVRPLSQVLGVGLGLGQVFFGGCYSVYHRRADSEVRIP